MPLTLDGVISILDDDKNILEAKVFMGPPENPLLSDEDNEDEDFINPDINHLSGNQLRATAELHTKHLQDTGIVSTIMGEEDIPEEYLENVNTPDNENKSNRIKTITPCRKGQDMDLPLAPEPTWKQPEWIQNNYILKLIVNCSNNYAFQKGNIKFKVTINEIKVFLGILLFSGYCSVPRYRIYWETSSDTNNEAMSRNTFEDILKYLHVCDNLTLDENDKFGKIDNFFNSVRLLEELKSKGHYCTGTIRSNRIEKASLEEAFTLKKKVRGSYSQLTDTDGGITLIRYHDNNIVTVASTLRRAKPIGKARRWSHKEKKRIQIDQPACIINYNCYMKGVDRLDQNISTHRRKSSSRTITKTFEKTSFTDPNSSDPAPNSSNLEPVPELSTSQEKKKKKPIIQWVRTDIKEVRSKTWTLPQFMGEDMSPVQIFELNFDDLIVKMLVDFTNIYARLADDMTFESTLGGMRIFLAILLLTGYNPLLRYKMYWEIIKHYLKLYHEVYLRRSLSIYTCVIIPSYQPLHYFAKHNEKYDFFFDNFFTSLSILDEFKDSGCTGTGTVRSNRVENAPLKESILTDTNSGTTLNRYHDNSIKQKWGTSYTEIKAFIVEMTIDFAKLDIISYNSFMGGVDRLDENLSKLRIHFRMKKWYYQLFAFPINLSINNAWRIYRQMSRYKERLLDLLRFTRKVTNCYFQKYSARRIIGRPLRNPTSIDKRVLDDVRYDKLEHIISPLGKHERCQLFCQISLKSNFFSCVF
uniref:(California timema) hypothetical protein n=1 Tax=Timema californicum TaxID=61474 RepID=A0A7R9PAB9_TIMCA|nr:unnamed protein product [Timema californicum]